MSKHKFEPFDRVLVRDEDGENWHCDFFSHKDGYRFYTVSAWFNQIIPYNENTKHLIGTTESYEPPKPPHEYKWGDKVEVNFCGDWGIALYIAPTTDREEHWCSTKKRPYNMTAFKISEIRPLEPSHD